MNGAAHRMPTILPIFTPALLLLLVDSPHCGQTGVNFRPDAGVGTESLRDVDDDFGVRLAMLRLFGAVSGADCVGECVRMLGRRGYSDCGLARVNSEMSAGCITIRLIIKTIRLSRLPQGGPEFAPNRVV